MANARWALYCQADLWQDNSVRNDRLWTTLCTVSISCPVIYISLDSLRSIWLARDLQQTPTWRKLSPPSCRHLTVISNVRGGIRLVATMEKFLKVRGLMFTICYPSAVIHRRQNKVIGMEAFVALDPDSRRTEIAASLALPVGTRNGLSEDCIVSGSTWCKIDSSIAPK